MPFTNVARKCSKFLWIIDYLVPTVKVWSWSQEYISRDANQTTRLNRLRKCPIAWKYILPPVSRYRKMCSKFLHFNMASFVLSEMVLVMSWIIKCYWHNIFIIIFKFKKTKHGKITSLTREMLNTRAIFKYKYNK